MNQAFTKNEKMINYLKKASVYEVNLRQYTPEGNFEAFRQHLPRLKKMGVTIIWLMPIHPIGHQNRKGSRGSYYAIADFFQINPEFGDLDDFKNLVSAIHEYGMKIIIDWVANHVACDHQWTFTHPDYFLRDDSGKFLAPYDWTDVIQIDHANPAAHEEMLNAMCFWVKEVDIDGFRADMAHLTPLSFWSKAKSRTESIKPNLIWLAETENKEYFQVFDMIYTWKWMHGTESFFKDPNRGASKLLEILRTQEMDFFDGGLGLFFTSNHDENSWNGTEFEKYGIYFKGLAAWSFLYAHSVPLVYGGQEIPNTKRLLFFDKDELDWNKKNEYFLFYQKMMGYRNSLHLSEVTNWVEHSAQVFGFRRANDLNAIVFLFNISETAASFNLIDYGWKGNYRVVFREGALATESSSDIYLLPGEFILLETVEQKQPSNEGCE
jgi:glycosidase